MATMIDGESYLGKVLVRPLDKNGNTTLYLWPLRCLKSKMGGPTFGVDIRGKEILRFDPHGPRGHWHKGGYDALGAGGSHQDFPEGEEEIAEQVTWSLTQIHEQGSRLLAEAGYPVEADLLNKEMIEAATAAVIERLAEERDLRSRAIEQGLLV